MSSPCIIYCRVSSIKQLKEGDGLKGQEKRCRDYAAVQGYRLLRVFYEEAITGGIAERPAMQQMLDFLAAQSGETIVIVDDLKRFARDVESHFDLKVAIYQRGGRLESPSFKFEDTPEGKFIETIMAASAELERNQNTRQVRNRMKARLEQGYWTFNPPTGYLFKAHPVHKKILILNQTKAPLVKQALEGYANDRFRNVSEVRRFLAAHGYFGPRPDLRLPKYQAHVKRMLKQVLLYTGYLAYKPWDVPLRRGYHPALISFDTYQKIQQKLQSRPTQSRAATRVDMRTEFPLRHFISCHTCQRPLTGSWSRGRTARYAYYHCYNKVCEQYGKAIPKKTIEGDFSCELQGLQMDDQTLNATCVMAQDIWKHKVQQEERSAHQKAQQESRRLQTVEEDLNGLADKLGRTRSEIVINRLEKRIEELENQRLVLEEAKTKAPAPHVEFGTAFQSVQKLLQNPYITWKEGDLPLRRLVQRLVFATPPSYDRNSGFGTIELSLPYLISRRVMADELRLVDIPLESWNSYLEAVFKWAELVEATDGQEPQGSPISLTQSGGL